MITAYILSLSMQVYYIESEFYIDNEVASYVGDVVCYDVPEQCWSDGEDTL